MHWGCRCGCLSFLASTTAGTGASISICVGTPSESRRNRQPARRVDRRTPSPGKSATRPPHCRLTSIKIGATIGSRRAFSVDMAIARAPSSRVLARAADGPGLHFGEGSRRSRIPHQPNCRQKLVEGEQCRTPRGTLPDRWRRSTDRCGTLGSTRLLFASPLVDAGTEPRVRPGGQTCQGRRSGSSRAGVFGRGQAARCPQSREAGLIPFCAIGCGVALTRRRTILRTMPGPL